MSDKAGRSRWVVVPLILTLVILLVRWYGERSGASTAFFGTEPGGMQSPLEEGDPMPSWVGIFWLMPILGIYFAFRMVRSGQVPESKGKALLFSLLGFAAVAGVLELFKSLLEAEERQGTNFALWAMPVVVVVLWSVALLLVRRGWAGLFGLMCLYGFGARILVVAVPLIEAWLDPERNTHFEKPHPSVPADLSDFTNLFYLSLAQLGMWIPLTIAIGGLCGAVTALVVPRGRS